MLNPSDDEKGKTKPSNVIPFILPRNQDRAPVRKVITASKPTVRGALPSTKAKGSIQCESGLESRVAAYIELSPGIVDWCCQPTTFKLEVANEIRSYTPDFQVKFKSGRTAFVEVKPLRKCFQVDIRDKLIAAEIWLHRRGIPFLIVTDQDLGSRDTDQNLNLLRYYQRVPVAHSKRVNARKLVSKRSLISVIDLEDAGLNKPQIYSLIANRALVTDLSVLLNPYSPLMLPEESDDEECLFKGRSAHDLT